MRTSALVWTFHTIPKPGEPGYETWPNDNPRQRHGGANAWGGMSIDEARGVLYADNEIAFAPRLVGDHVGVGNQIAVADLNGNNKAEIVSTARRGTVIYENALGQGD